MKSPIFRLLFGFCLFAFIIPACKRIVYINTHIPFSMNLACAEIKEFNQKLEREIDAVKEDIVIIKDNKGYIHEGVWDYFDIEEKELMSKIIAECARDFNTEKVGIYSQHTGEVLAIYTEDKGFQLPSPPSTTMFNSKFGIYGEK